MENPNQDETRPTPVDPADTLSFDLSDTQPTNVTNKPAEVPDPAQTIPVTVDGESVTETPDLAPTVPVAIESESVEEPAIETQGSAG